VPDAFTTKADPNGRAAGDALSPIDTIANGSVPHELTPEHMAATPITLMPVLCCRVLMQVEKHHEKYKWSHERRDNDLPLDAQENPNSPMRNSVAQSGNPGLFTNWCGRCLCRSIPHGTQFQLKDTDKKLHWR
jgi:hypothetical protein